VTKTGVRELPAPLLLLPWNWRSRSLVPLIPAPEACDRIVTTGFVKLATLNANGANDQLFLFHPVIQVESERATLVPRFGGGLFECNEIPRLVNRVAPRTGYSVASRV
jgi:hypothetical protein